MTTIQDVNIQLLTLPGRQNEVVIENEDGSYTIVIDEQLSSEGRLRAYEHAMRHINNNDFENNDVQSIETIAHKSKMPTEPAAKSKHPLYAERLKRKRTRRRQWKEIEEKIAFLQENDVDFFARAEEHYLYGDIK